MTTTQMIRDLVYQLSFTGSVYAKEVISADNVVLWTYNTGHATQGNYVRINGAEYQVKAVTVNHAIYLSEDPGAVTEFSVDAPYFWHGTPLQVETILANLTNWRDKLPMIYLVEPYDEDENHDRMSKIDRTFSGTLLFAMPTPDKDWSVEDHYNNLIEPIDNLKDAFVELLQFNNQITNFERARKTNRVNIGLWVSKDGRRTPLKDNIKKLFDENITAIEFIPTFDINKNYKCKASLINSRGFDYETEIEF